MVEKIIKLCFLQAFRLCFLQVMFSTGFVQSEFPAQIQDKQPAKQYLMNPIPVSIQPDYIGSKKLQGKIALVTGGDSGIGRAVCYHLAVEGAAVAFTYVPGQEDRDAEETLKKIRELKAPDVPDPIALPTDVRFDDNCRKVVEDVANKYGRIDILVNNAAVAYYHESIDEITPDAFENTFRTNAFPYFFFTRHALKYMKEGSSVINTASVLAYTGGANLLDYGATKGAIVSFTRSLALQLMGKGIRVNAVAPGPVWTPLAVASNPEEDIPNFGSDAPMGRAAQPFEIAPSYVFLASQGASYITGQVLHPNGGFIVNG